MLPPLEASLTIGQFAWPSEGSAERFIQSHSPIVLCFPLKDLNVELVHFLADFLFCGQQLRHVPMLR